MRPDPIIFDLDGTLVDSLPGIASALNDALSARNLDPHSLEAVRGFVGSGVWELCRRAVPDRMADIDSLVEAFKSRYQRTWKGGSQLFSGVECFLARLATAGHRLAVLSNKPHDFTCEMVGTLFPDSPFDLVRGQIDGQPHKPEPGAVTPLLDHWQVEPQACHFIGDSDVDRLTAEAAGIPFVGVTWGYQAATRLGPVVASNLTELEAQLSNPPHPLIFRRR